MTKEVFINTVYPFAEKAARALNIPVEWVIAHWAHETGYFVNSRNNLAGIWAYPGSPHGIAGKNYPDLDSFVDDYVKTMSQGRYSTAFEQNNVTDFARELRLGGYATDPKYEQAGTWTEAVKLAGGMVEKVLSWTDIKAAYEHNDPVFMSRVERFKAYMPNLLKNIYLPKPGQKMQGTIDKGKEVIDGITSFDPASLFNRVGIILVGLVVGVLMVIGIYKGSIEGGKSDA